MSFEIRDPARVNGGLEALPKKEENDRWWRGWGSYEIEVIRKKGGKSETTQVIKVTPALYLNICVAYILLHIILGFIVNWYQDVPIANLGQNWTWGGAILSLQLLHLALSFTYVKADEIGGYLFFGQPLMEVSRGLKFRPLFLIDLKTFSRKIIQAQFPGDPEIIFKGEDKEYFLLPKDEREKMVLPIRAASGKPKETPKGTKNADESALDSQMTLEVNFYARWQIEHFFVFLIRVGSIKEALRQLRDSGESVIIQQIGQRTPRIVIEELAKINKALHAELIKITADWGIRMAEAKMLTPDLTKTVNVSLRNVAVAKSNASETMVTARAEEVKRTREGQGDANATLSELKALATGAKALGVKGDDVIALQKTRAIAGENTTIFVDGEGGSLIGLGKKLAAGAGQTLLPNNTEDKPQQGEN